MTNPFKFKRAITTQAINTHLSEEGNQNELFEMVVNGLMLGERSEFFTQKTQSKNKGNGYRKIKRAAIGSSAIQM